MTLCNRNQKVAVHDWATSARIACGWQQFELEVVLLHRGCGVLTGAPQAINKRLVHMSEAHTIFFPQFARNTTFLKRALDDI
jgi:hypothetical protein